MLDFARKKLQEHEHPVLSVLNTNTRAIALYRRMGWQLPAARAGVHTGAYPAVAKDPLVVRPGRRRNALSGLKKQNGQSDRRWRRKP